MAVKFSQVWSGEVQELDPDPPVCTTKPTRPTGPKIQQNKKLNCVMDDVWAELQMAETDDWVAGLDVTSRA